MDWAGEPQGWSGPIGQMDDEERRSLIASMTARELPRIDLDEALDEGWFEFWYQPKIDLRRKCLAGAEALARIRHPALGVMLPGSFLPGIGESSIARLTEQALIATLASWSGFYESGFNLSLSVNLPVSVLHALPIPELVAEHRPQSNRWPGIILEVTEDQIVRDLRLANDIATRLQVAGIKIAIDDFGAGYSSLSSLRELPFAEIKLDRGFVRNCASDATNAAICETAIDLAHRFGSAAVAGGIESEADLEMLIGVGCDFGQGVLLAPPMPQQRFLTLLRQREESESRAVAASVVDAAHALASLDNVA